MTPEERIRLYSEHPDECPEIVGTLPYLIHPPSKLASTARWVQFRDRTLRPLIASRPDDPNLPRFLEQAGKVLEWRARIPPERIFWKPDR